MLANVALQGEHADHGLCGHGGLPPKKLVPISVGNRAHRVGRRGWPPGARTPAYSVAGSAAAGTARAARRADTARQPRAITATIAGSE
ncbi:hypothetical protein GTS_04300 [Gandjariella thermophila]|uniref:Uncharacterized protein n=1 Tax=Gandjariella thermophila TaxID=1931992 RepID=A0A4D4J499_9PSEU|nr:hypothetical protein GTS_04300 [Gandjariella thermophila]